MKTMTTKNKRRKVRMALCIQASASRSSAIKTKNNINNLNNNYHIFNHHFSILPKSILSVAKTIGVWICIIRRKPISIIEKMNREIMMPVNRLGYKY